MDGLPDVQAPRSACPVAFASLNKFKEAPCKLLDRKRAWCKPYMTETRKENAVCTAIETDENQICGQTKTRQEQRPFGQLLLPFSYVYGRFGNQLVRYTNENSFCDVPRRMRPRHAVPHTRRSRAKARCLNGRELARRTDRDNAFDGAHRHSRTARQHKSTRIA